MKNAVFGGVRPHIPAFLSLSPGRYRSAESLELLFFRLFSRFILSTSPEISFTPIQSSCSSHHLPNVGLMPGTLVSVLHRTYPGQTPNFTRLSLSFFFYPVINFGNRRGTTAPGAPTVSNCSAALPVTTSKHGPLVIEWPGNTHTTNTACS